VYNHVSTFLYAIASAIALGHGFDLSDRGLVFRTITFKNPARGEAGIGEDHCLITPPLQYVLILIEQVSCLA